MQGVGRKVRIGLVGYGALGAYLADAIFKRGDEMELVFVWNRSVNKA